jgi:hypothetical protein
LRNQDSTAIFSLKTLRKKRHDRLRSFVKIPPVYRFVLKTILEYNIWDAYIPTQTQTLKRHTCRRLRERGRSDRVPGGYSTHRDVLTIRALA